MLVKVGTLREDSVLAAPRIVSLGTSECTAVAEIQLRRDDRDDGSGKSARSALLRFTWARSS